MPDIITQTDRLTLRLPTMDDVDVLAGYWADPETMRYIGKEGTGWTREQVVERIERAIRFCAEHGMTFWTVVENETGMVIGQGGLVPIEFNGPEIELGYRLGKPHWGKGYASEIAAASARYGFTSKGLDRLVAVTYLENTASRRVLEKTGFIETGETHLYYGVHCLSYELTKARWEGATTRRAAAQ
jgi:RimJ/RimL family protein N-acetyltransferase